jgi:hypothetical protein
MLASAPVVSNDLTHERLRVECPGSWIVMRHEDLREATRQAAEKSPRKLQTRLTPGG